MNTGKKLLTDTSALVGSERFWIKFDDISQSSSNAHWGLVSVGTRDVAVKLHQEEWLIQNLSHYLPGWISLLKNPLQVSVADEGRLASASLLFNMSYMHHTAAAAVEALQQLLEFRIEGKVRPWDVRERLNAIDLQCDNPNGSTEVAYIFAWQPQTWFVSYSNETSFVVRSVLREDCVRVFEELETMLEEVKAS